MNSTSLVSSRCLFPEVSSPILLLPVSCTITMTPTPNFQSIFLFIYPPPTPYVTFRFSFYWILFPTISLLQPTPQLPLCTSPASLHPKVRLSLPICKSSFVKESHLAVGCGCVEEETLVGGEWGNFYFVFLFGIHKQTDPCVRNDR